MKEQRIGFFLTPTFAMLPFITAVETLRFANESSGKSIYSWKFITLDGQSVMSGNSMEVTADTSINDAFDFDIVIVAGAYLPHLYRQPRVNTWLRSLASRKTTLCAICTGSYLLAQAGLLNNYRCTIHWQYYASLKAAFPKLIVTPNRFEVDRDRRSCAGGNAAMDMMLHLIEEQHGEELAGTISEALLVSHVREANQNQRASLRKRTGISNPHLLECFEFMEANIEQPLSTPELADLIGISKRQLERLFKQYLSSTPSSYYIEVRLHQARQLLIQTHTRITDIAMNCGFYSPGYFSSRYRNMFGYTPREERSAAQLSAKKICV